MIKSNEIARKAVTTKYLHFSHPRLFSRVVNAQRVNPNPLQAHPQLARATPLKPWRAGNVRYRLKVWKRNERGSGYFV